MTDKYEVLRAALEQVEKFNHPDTISAYRWHSRPETIRALLAERDELERALALAGKINNALMDQHLADSKTLRDYAQQRDDLRKERDALLENGKQAVRWAPSSAHWSNELKRLFGEDAREGIDVLEAQLRAAQAERDALRSAVLAIDSLRGPFMSDDDIASVWKLVDSALAQHQGEMHGDK